jgi:hypothetical protein
MSRNNLSTCVKKFKQDPIVIEFITSLIEDNFPRDSAPKWVNYDLFFEEKFGECFDFMVDNLNDKFYTYDDHALAFGYYSDNLDTGSSPAHSTVDDFCEVKIPEKIIKQYKKYLLGVL